jgi:hypothetical protein
MKCLNPRANAEDAATPRTFTVANTDATLLAFLSALAWDRAASYALADWLAERDDPRAESARELAMAPAVVPVGVPGWHHVRPMIASRSFFVTRRPSGVTARAYPGTMLGTLLGADGYRDNVTVRIPREKQTPERLIAACERCCAILCLGLFGASRQLFKTR